MGPAVIAVMPISMLIIAPNHAKTAHNIVPLAMTVGLVLNAIMHSGALRMGYVIQNVQVDSPGTIILASAR
jgi:hypothetical protein